MKIFYSWQSDHPGKTSRHFIRECVEEAIANLNSQITYESADREELPDESQNIQLDHDTKGVRGTPDLAATIFDKIRNSQVFIGDVTVVGKGFSNERSVPNPNVLIELGFALGVLGSDQVILIMDERYGTGKELPFDLQHKRHPIAFDSRKLSGKKNGERKRFVGTLQDAIAMYVNDIAEPIFEPLPPTPSLEQIFQTVLVSDSMDDWIHISPANNWKETRVFKHNVNLRFEMNYDGEGVHKERFTEEWATRFPDSEATSYWCDLCYGTTLLRQSVLVSVDGARAFLPLPRLADLSVSTFEYKVAKIHDGSGSLEKYLKRSGITVRWSFDRANI